MERYSLSHLDCLEHEAIHIIREAGAQFASAVILFSGGKDSLVLAALTRKAFAPARPPFPLLHIDTGHNFPETIEFRDRMARIFEYELFIRAVQDYAHLGPIAHEVPFSGSRNALQTATLLKAIFDMKCDAALGGGRRDEEKARSKERIFSHRNSSGKWEPNCQRPELWDLYNGRKHVGEHFRVFPLSNWTELDIWAYIQREKLPLPGLYFSHVREVFLRHGSLLAASPILPLRAGEVVTRERVRFRTVGDMSCTGAIRSDATTLAEIITEVAGARLTEREARHDDRFSETSMEDRKCEGYF